MKKEDKKVVQACIEYVNQLLGYDAVEPNAVILAFVGRVSMRLRVVADDPRQTFRTVVRKLNAKFPGKGGTLHYSFVYASKPWVFDGDREVLLRKDRDNVVIRLTDRSRVREAAKEACNES